MPDDPIPPGRLRSLAALASRELTRLAPGGLRVLELPVDVDRVAQWHGLIIDRVDGDMYARVERPNLDGTLLSGMFDFMNGVILVRADQVAGRQRFTIAHEIAHYLIEDHFQLYAGKLRYTIDVDGTTRDVDLGGQHEQRQQGIALAEREADALAGMLLMPAALVDAAVAELGPSVPLLAARFGVSATAMRLNMAGYLPQIEWV